MTVYYEWDAEGVDRSTGDITAHHHTETALEMVEMFKSHPDDTDMVLVRDDDNGRSWAYVKDGKLPTHFENSYQVPGAKVPIKHQREFDRAINT